MSAPQTARVREVDRELLRRLHEEGDATARERLVARHLPLVRSLARRYAGRGEALEDIEQVGAIGLLKAIDRFELGRGCRSPPSPRRRWWARSSAISATRGGPFACPARCRS
ncbi:MAG: sigma factor [Thermoleophilaceae bacterium]